MAPTGIKKAYKQYMHNIRMTVSRTTLWRLKKREKLRRIIENEAAECGATENEDNWSCCDTPLQNDENEDSSSFNNSFDDYEAEEGGDDTLGNDDFDDCESSQEEQIDNETKNPSETSWSFDASDETVLFPASGIKAKDLLLMVVFLGLRYSLSEVVMLHIFEILKTCGGPNLSFNYSKYFRAKKFNLQDDSIRRIYFCASCELKILETANRIIDNQKQEKMSCSVCGERQVINSHNHNYFITVDIRQQVRSLLENPELSKLLIQNKQNITLRNADVTNYQDIHDGTLYKKFRDFHLSYNFNVDGAPVFNSSKFSMWPILLIINEFPPEIRFRHVILAGMWYHNKEPNMNLFMQEFVKQANDLYHNGINWKNSDGNTINSKFVAMCCCVDSVARPMLQKFTQFNGYYGCPWCYHPGKLVNRQIKYTINVDPYDSRNHLTTVQEMKEAYATETKVNGVKGPSCLINLPQFDIIDGCPPDYMHSVLLGVAKQLWEYWTTYDKNKTCYLGSPHILKKINGRLIMISPPHEIHRHPRSITDKAKWKATEWRSWLIYYSIPVLDTILNVTYLKHYSLLVNSVSMLLQKSVSIEQISKAENDLKTFVIEMNKLYGDESMTFNVHILLHLPEFVHKTGPLWATSAFPFESAMYTLKKFANGPTGANLQIVNGFTKFNVHFNTMSGAKEPINEDVKMFVEGLRLRGTLKKVCDSDVVFLGKEQLSNEKLSDFNGNTFFKYKRCLYKGKLLHTEDYKSKTGLKNNDSVVHLSDNQFAIIIEFMSFNSHCFMKVQKLVARPYKVGNFVLHHLYVVNKTSNFSIIKPSHILNKCIYYKVGDTFILSTLTNDIEVQ